MGLCQSDALKPLFHLAHWTNPEWANPRGFILNITQMGSLLEKQVYSMMTGDNRANRHRLRISRPKKNIQNGHILKRSGVQTHFSLNDHCCDLLYDFPCGNLHVPMVPVTSQMTSLKWPISFKRSTGLEWPVLVGNGPFP